MNSFQNPSTLYLSLFPNEYKAANGFNIINSAIANKLFPVSIEPFQTKSVYVLAVKWNEQIFCNNIGTVYWTLNVNRDKSIKNTRDTQKKWRDKEVKGAPLWIESEICENTCKISREKQHYYYYFMNKNMQLRAYLHKTSSMFISI